MPLNRSPFPWSPWGQGNYLHSGRLAASLMAVSWGCLCGGSSSGDQVPCICSWSRWSLQLVPNVPDQCQNPAENGTLLCIFWGLDTNSALDDIQRNYDLVHRVLCQIKLTWDRAVKAADEVWQLVSCTCMPVWHTCIIMVWGEDPFQIKTSETFVFP